MPFFVAEISNGGVFTISYSHIIPHHTRDLREKEPAKPICEDVITLAMDQSLFHWCTNCCAILTWKSCLPLPGQKLNMLSRFLPSWKVQQDGVSRNL